MQRGIREHKNRRRLREKLLVYYQCLLLDANEHRPFHTVLYTDGSASLIGRPGGWAVVGVHLGTRFTEVAGPIPSSSSNRAELEAVIMALRLAGRIIESGKAEQVLIRSDSEYCTRGCQEWLWNWASDNWRGHNDKKPNNLDLWAQICSLIEAYPRRFAFRWVRGHTGNAHNERADELARQQRLIAQARLQEGVNP